MRLDGGTTVPGDRAPFLLMIVSLGEGLYRLICFHINQKKSGLTSIDCSMGRGTVNGACNDFVVF